MLGTPFYEHDYAIKEKSTVFVYIPLITVGCDITRRAITSNTRILPTDLE